MPTVGNTIPLAGILDCKSGEKGLSSSTKSSLSASWLRVRYKFLLPGLPTVIDCMYP